MKTINNVFIDDEENIVISYENEDGLVHEFETPLSNAIADYDFIGTLSEPDFKLLDRQIKRCGNHYEIIYRLFSAGGVPVILGVIEINDGFINDSLPFEGRKTLDLLNDITIKCELKAPDYYLVGNNIYFNSYNEALIGCKLNNLDFNLIKPQWKT